MCYFFPTISHCWSWRWRSKCWNCIEHHGFIESVRGNWTGDLSVFRYFLEPFLTGSLMLPSCPIHTLMTAYLVTQIQHTHVLLIVLLTYSSFLIVIITINWIQIQNIRSIWWFYCEYHTLITWRMHLLNFSGSRSERFCWSSDSS